MDDGGTVSEQVLQGRIGNVSDKWRKGSGQVFGELREEDAGALETETGIDGGEEEAMCVTIGGTGCEDDRFVGEGGGNELPPPAHPSGGGVVAGEAGEGDIGGPVGRWGSEPLRPETEDGVG